MARRQPRRVAGALAVAGALTAVAALPASATGSPAHEAASAAHTGERSRPHAATARALDAVVADGTPGVVARVDDADGTWRRSVGVADRETGRPRLARDRFRVGSVTKPFTATVLLQLAAEGRLSLDDTVHTWLPGPVRNAHYDGRRITLRQLLNHTSGIFNYNDDPGFLAKFTGQGFLQHRYDGATPRELVAIGLAQPPVFPPGEGWSYSDTNYILVGLVIEKVTGHDYEDEVENRIIKPLKLTSTTLPRSSPTLPAPHGRHYSRLYEEDPAAPVHDVTEFNPTVAWAAGTVISTPRDLNTFTRALLRGRLLPAAQLAEMLQGVPVPSDGGETPPAAPRRPPNETPQATYGLGIRSFTLSCGVEVWGHGGQVPGSLTRTAATRDGEHVLTMNRNADYGAQEREDATLEAEFCRR
ncbi:beta-lactamase family protein [Streptomyces sp. AC536]|uniref:serine hydrolase domain-containing protein n=1 Tax=Streptomyces buecherae TaxID=2763006 RepID=UPI00164E18CD|nr:serine hydrolase domain-containing protein [Streptomyces buecherae]MBC3985759.1 beta-lactamase family protein [Streptomyces buecherae]QNJ39875.1 beta-lactamase family protein [Streptomyces buecherae]